MRLARRWRVSEPVEIDHLFLLIDAGWPEEAELCEAAGLSEAYRRRHPGQGTANACYAFPELFVELLWIDDAPATLAPGVERLGLSRRVR
jgi:hypothetical protein